jgi:type I restriction enzyme S subunit
MDVKPGYKQSEIGVIPKDWDVQALGDIAAIAAGGTPSRRVSEYWNGGIPWVTTTEIDFKTIRETAESISTLGLKNSAAKFLAPETLLLALYGQGKTRGKVAVLGIEATTNQACASIVLSPDVSQGFIFYFLSSQYKAIRSMSNAGSQDNLSGRIVKQIMVPLPPTKAEQDAIAQSLSDADAFIESLEQLLAKKRNLKRGAIQELLTGKKRLLGFAVTSGYQETEVGNTPEDWCLRRVAEFATTVASGRSHVGSEFGDYPVHGSTGVIGRCIKPDYSGKAILIARVGANAGKLTVVDGEYGVTDNTIILKIDESLDYEYFWRQLEAKDLNSMVFGSGQPLITGTQVKSLIVPLPPTKPEQVAIAGILNDMDAEIAAVEKKLTKARLLKHGMMQELLTGRIRLV